MTSPQWFVPYSLRESWLGPLQPVVGLTGLDVEGDSVDRRVWELLNMGTDFTPTFVINPNLPRKKARREGLEQTTYVPEGILPVRWADKHRSIIPAVIVVFFKDDASLTVNKALSKLRDDCTPFGIHLLVMLIKGVGEEEVSTERASALCAAADVPPKSLFILVTSHPDRIHASVHRLERGIREACTSYYTGRARRLKTKKERITQQQIALQARYNAKLGFFFEIRRDYGSAVSSYEMAISALVLFGPRGVQESRVVSSILNYRLCRIHLLRREWQEAKVKFQKHIDTFRTPNVDNKSNYFEVLAFMEHQYQDFGDLAKQYYSPEFNMAPDPVNYYIAAANYAKIRAEMAVKRKMTRGEVNLPSGLEGVVDPHWEPKFLGQRPWRVEEDEGKLGLLQNLEDQVPHSEFIIKHLGLASDFCKDIGRLRTRCQLMSLMGDEFLRSGDFSRAILLMAHVLREFGKERWSSLLLHAGRVGLKAAVGLPDVSAYLNFVVILLKTDLRQYLKDGEVEQLASNLDAVINKKIPQDKGLDADQFRLGLESSGGEIKSYIGVHGYPLLSASIGFKEESAFIHRSTTVHFHLKNRHVKPIHVKSVGIQTNTPESDVTLAVGKVLKEGESYQGTLEVIPREANKVIQLQVGVVDIGKGDVSILLHYSLIHKAAPTLWNEEWGLEKSNIGLTNVLKVEGSRPLMECRVEREETALVGEVHPLKFFWSNTDTTNHISRVSLTFLLSTTNPSLVRLSHDPNLLVPSNAGGEEVSSSSSGGGLSYSVEVDKLGNNSVHETTLYLRVHGETELRVIAKIKYIDAWGQAVTTDFITPISVIAPFGVKTSTRDGQGEVLPALVLKQPFLLLHEVTNMTGVEVHVASIKCKGLSKHIVQQNRGCDCTTENTVLQPGEIISALQWMQAVEPPPPHTPPVGGDGGNMASVTVQWCRKKTGTLLVSSEYVIPLPRIEGWEASSGGGDVGGGLYLTGQFGEALLKKEMTADYVLLNRNRFCMDLIISIDSTEYFMNAGPKRISIKLNGGDHVRLSYVLFPLKTGLVFAPRLLIEGPAPGSAEGSGQGLILIRDHSKMVFVRKDEDVILPAE